MSSTGSWDSLCSARGCLHGGVGEGATAFLVGLWLLCCFFLSWAGRHRKVGTMGHWPLQDAVVPEMGGGGSLGLPTSTKAGEGGPSAGDNRDE